MESIVYGVPGSLHGVIRGKPIWVSKLQPRVTSKAPILKLFSWCASASWARLTSLLISSLPLRLVHSPSEGVSSAEGASQLKIQPVGHSPSVVSVQLKLESTVQTVPSPSQLAWSVEVPSLQLPTVAAVTVQSPP